jgi:threonyl-tRNA synthetase
VDFAMPERFQLEYTDKDNKKKRPIMIHRAIYGSLERFIGILIEHLNGRFPTWLAPIQVRVLNFTDRNTKAAEVLVEKLKDKIPNLRIDSDLSQSTMGSKVKNAEIARIPYILTIGDKEEKAGTVAVRAKGSKKLENLKIDELISRLKKEIENRE